MPQVLLITCSVGWLAIKGYKEATSPHSTQPDLPMKGIVEMERKALNRPVLDLPQTGDLVDGASENGAHLKTAAPASTHAERVKEALGSMFMDITCSNCGSSKVIRAGACGCCTECGTSQGCS